jgi:hypothetical protein
MNTFAVHFIHQPKQHISLGHYCHMLVTKHGVWISTRNWIY